MKSFLYRARTQSRIAREMQIGGWDLWAPAQYILGNNDKMLLYRYFAKAGKPTQVPSLSKKEIKEANINVKEKNVAGKRASTLNATTTTRLKKGRRSGSMQLRMELQENKHQTFSEECFQLWCDLKQPLQHTVIILLQDNPLPILKT